MTRVPTGELLRRALAAYSQRDFAQAATLCAAIVEHDAGNFGAHSLLGAIALLQGMPSDAAAAFRTALQAKPYDANTHLQYGRALAANGELDAAAASYRRAVALQPDLTDAWLHLALALRSSHQTHEAHAAYERSLEIRRQALARRPEDHVGRYGLSKEFQQMGDMDAALACCREALAIDPEYTPARGALLHYQLRTIYKSAEEIAQSRAAFAHELAMLEPWLDGKPGPEAYTAFETTRTFFLAYAEQSNVELLSRFGAFCARTMRRWQVAQRIGVPTTFAGGRIRLGIVLAHVRSGPVWDTLVRGWVEHLDRSTFEVRIFGIEPTRDAQNAALYEHVEFVDLSDKDLHETAHAIAQARVDMLVYPEVSMNRKVGVLASLRLAPVQAASWGHPETTGLPTMDYFVSAQALEPLDAKRNYTERLVTLPGLGCCYMPAAVATVALDLSPMGIDGSRPVLVCPGTPIKYAPQFDDVLVKIAQRLPSAQLVFFEYERLHYTRLLQERLQLAFERGGMAMREHVLFVPWLEASRFVALLAQSTLMLDTIGFSGFNTAMRAIEAALPIVTREGKFMRGRLAGGILRALALDELIAADDDHYVDIVCTMATDRACNASVRERIAARRHTLYEDVTSVRAFERFCVDAVRAH